MGTEKEAMILISHGSKRPTWLKPFETIREEAQRSLSVELGQRVGLAVLEGRGASLSQCVREAVRKGATRVGILPLFLTASTHLAEDVPEQVEQVQKEYGSEVTLELLSTSPLHKRIWNHTRERIDRHELEPSTTWVVTPYYGSERYADAWTHLLQTAEESVRSWGYAGFTAAPVGHIVGASPIPTRDAVREALFRAETVVVLPLLLSAGIFQHEKIPTALSDLQPEERNRVYYTPDGILPDPGVMQWVVRTTREWVHSANETTNS